MITKVICVHEKYYSFTEQCGISTCNLYIYHSLWGSGLIQNLEFFPYDQINQLGLAGMCQALLNKCRDEAPQLVVFFLPWYGYWPELITVLNALRSEGIKVVALCSDMITGQMDSTRHYLIQEYANAADCIVNIDSIEANVPGGHPLHIKGYTGVSPTIFSRQPQEKDIDVSFMGSRSWIYQYRGEYIDYLRQNLSPQINFIIGGGQLPEEQNTGQVLALEDYVNYFRRSKITLNFSRTLGNVHQLKGRIFEALACHTLLLEQDNPNTRAFFQEGTEFCAFASPADLLEKIIYYLHHDEERETIANSGWQKARNIWNPRNLWGYVFERLGFDVSEAYDDNFAVHRQLLDAIQ